MVVGLTSVMKIYKPAIITAGLDAYRADADDLAQVPIDTIEEKNTSSNNLCCRYYFE